MSANEDSAREARPGRSGSSAFRRYRHLFWIPGSALLLLSLVLLAAPFYLVRQDAAREWLLRRSLGPSLAENVGVHVGRVERFRPGWISLHDLWMEEDTPEGPRAFFRVGEVTIRWNPWDLLGGRITVEELRVVRPWLDVSLLPDRIGAAPGGADTRRDAPRAPELPALSCRSFSIEGVVVERGGQPWLRGDFALTDLRHAERDLHVYLREGRVRSEPDSLELSLSHGVLNGTWIDYLEVDSLRLESEAIDAGLAATFIAAPSGSTAVSLDGVLRVGRVEPTRLAPLRRLDLPWEEGDRLEGTVLFGGELAPREEAHADLVLGLSGRAFGTVLDTLRILADATPSRAELVDFRLRSGAQVLAGEGIWEPKLRRAEGRVEFRELDLSGRPMSVFARDLPVSRLHGSVSGQVDSIGRGPRYDASVALESGLLEGRPIGEIRALVRGDPARVLLDTLWVGRETEAQLGARGELGLEGGRPLRLRGALAGLPMESWLEPWIGENLGGLVSGRFAIDGSWSRPELQADLSVRAGTVVDITVDSLEVGPVSGTLRPFRLEGPFHARGLDFYGFTLDSLRATGVFADTLRTRATGYRDSTAMELIARVVPTEPGAAFLDEITVRPGSAPSVRLAEPAVLGFSSRRVWIDSLAVESPAGRARGSAWILPRPGASGTEPFAFHVVGEELDLAAFADYLGLDPDTVSGTAWIDFRGEGTVAAPGYALGFRGETAELWGWLWERIDLSMRAGALGPPEGPGPRLFSSGTDAGLATRVLASADPGARGLVHVDSLDAVAFGFVGTIPQLAPDRYGPEPPGPPLAVQARDLRLRSPRTWFDWLRAMEGDSLFPALEEAELSGTVRVENLPIAPFVGPVLVPQAQQGTQATFAPETLDPMLAKIRVERPADLEEGFRRSAIAGWADLDVELAGTGGQPEIRLDAVARDVQIYQARADSVSLRAVYLDSLLYLSEARWARETQGVEASGRVPLALSLDPSHIGWVRRPLWIEIEVPSVDLALASLATALVEDPSGDLRGRVRLKGVPPAVYMEGTLDIEGGAFRIPLREERLSQVEAHLVLDSLGVHIESARGRWNPTGEAEVKGFYRSPDRFRLEGRVRDATVFETGNYRFVADGDFLAQPVAYGDTLRPVLTGDVLVHEGALTVDLAKPGRQKVLVTPWVIDLDVTVPSNVRVLQPTSSIDLAGGELQVRYDMPFWSLGGRLDIVSGQYLVFNKSLDIVEGRIEFLDTGTGPFPVLDVRAQTEVADPQADRTILVEIDVDGSPLPGEALTIQVRSPTHAEYTQEDLIDLLTIGQLRSGSFATGSSTDPARGFLTGQVLNQLERELIREAPWLDVVDVRGGTDPSDPIVISFRAITEPQWSVRYSQELTAHPGREVSVSYRISNLFFLNATADRREDEVGTSMETYSLDFRLRYEF